MKVDLKLKTFQVSVYLSQQDPSLNILSPSGDFYKGTLSDTKAKTKKLTIQGGRFSDF